MIILLNNLIKINPKISNFQNKLNQKMLFNTYNIISCFFQFK
jgi:hypothetical protein